MKKESYSGWDIRTERPDGLCDIVKRHFEIKKPHLYVWMEVCIEKKLNTDIDTYYLDFTANEPFCFTPDKNKYVTLHTHVNDDNYHALIDEANDVIRGVLTEMHEYIIAMINELPEI